MREMITFMLGLIIFLALMAVIGKNGLRITVNEKTYQFKINLFSDPEPRDHQLLPER